MRNILNKIRNAIYKFMYGRNGVDELGQFLLFFSSALIIVSLFVKGNTRYIFLILFWIIAIYSYFRVFSRNIYKRQAENNWFKSKTNYLKTRFTQRKTYKFYDCPKCKTHLRVPKGVGEITITCKKCGYQFDKKA